MVASADAVRVLVVDDDRVGAQALADLLAEGSGYATSVVTSGEAALAALAAGRRLPDAVLLDVQMQGLSGLDVLQAIRARHSPLVLPVVMVTAHDAGKQIAAALRAGANDYVTKPVDVDILLARLQAHLHLAELARLKDDVLRMASHDLKNPLTAVMLNARAIMDTPAGTPVDAELLDSARAILRRAGYMHRLINDFLDQQAARTGQLELTLAPVALDRLVAEVVEEQQDYARGRGLELSHSGEPVVVPADAARLAQVLHNLVGNAIKFTPAGGRVELVTGARAGHASIEVRDDGPGVGDDPERLFAAGARGPAVARGGESSSGLGLYIARVLVEKHGGTIRAENRPGGGARFTIELPGRAQD